MQVRVDFKSGRAVYLQVVDQIRAAAVSGALRPGDAVPGIGPLAGELRVNRNAVAKAYSELEVLGLIERQADGSYLLRAGHRPSQKDYGRKPLTTEIDLAVVQGPLVLRRTLFYSLLALLLVIFYFGSFNGISRVVRGDLAAVFSIAVLAAVFLPLRIVAQSAVDRVVFAKRFELPRVLRILKLEAPAQPDLDTFMERVAERTESVFGARLELVRDRVEVSSLLQSLPSLRSARMPIVAGADRLMPVFSADEVMGVLRLVPKPTGEEHDAKDLEFMAAISEQVALASNQFRMRNEKLESEYALDIQRGLLPRELPQLPGISIAGAWQPAKTVGGDYYDVFPIRETRLALIVADVSGKGMPAALLMSNLQATAKAYATLDPEPKELCHKVNRAICNSITPGKFITFFYAVLDWKELRLTYTNAGHNPPLLVSRDGACRRLESGGAVLGIFADGTYDQASIAMAPGDRLVLFTDGITEACDAGGEELGEERLITLLREGPATSAADLCEAILQRVTQFCRDDFADDATLLTVTVEPKS